MFGFIYVRCHASYENTCKLGKSKNIYGRDFQYATGELRRGRFGRVYKIPLEKMDILERLLQNEFKNYNVRYDGGIEFYDIKIIELIELYFQRLNLKYEKLTNVEIDNIEKMYRVRKPFIKFLKIIKKKLEKKMNTWNERDYQKNIINRCKEELNENKKIYVELPTGGGKSYIVYCLFNHLQIDLIVIVSPRKIINTQNISKKYLNLLNHNYKIFNYSNDVNLEQFLNLNDKKIITCCTQSLSKIYEKIKNVKNITVWFDEAHWSIEENVNNLNNEYVKYWLLSENIKYRIFTSASPNKLIVLNNQNIFGNLYKEISVRELINLKWLSDVEVNVYSENKHANDANFMLNDFKEKNKKFCFSFHNKQINAYQLFFIHYQKYKNGETFTKPFLLVSNQFKINQEIILSYKFRNVNVFEQNENSVGYVVAKYSVGYDFNKLDFLFFGDPKLSAQDIIQCIGRGTRPDGLGENGKNKNKKLLISLPVYVNEDNAYDNIIEVLKYLLYDVEIIFDDINIQNKHSKNEERKNNVIEDGTENIKSVILDLLQIENAMTFEKTKKFLKIKNIKNKSDYYDLCNRDKRFTKTPEITFQKKFIGWIDFLNVERNYYDLDTCKKKVEEYLQQNPEIKTNYLNLSLIVSKLCELDTLYPPCDLWTDYYGVDLGDIIVIKHGIKRNIVL